jgi:hypothetical protein
MGRQACLFRLFRFRSINQNQIRLYAAKSMRG